MFDIDFRNYKDLIKTTVKEVNDKDPNWKWSVHSVTKHKVMIRWGYLDYCEEKHPKNCFSLTVEYPTDVNLWNAIHCNKPDGEYINLRCFGDKSWDDDKTIELAIANSIRSIANYAHSRY